MNIVIADDEHIILRWLKKNLEEIASEYQVTDVCMNGKQVLNCCLNKQVDILFTDIRMPVMDGLELLEKLNANGIMPYTIILSAYSDFSYVRDAFKLGASDYLLKTEITKEDLKLCLDHAAERLAKNKNAEENVIPQDTGLFLALERLFRKAQVEKIEWENYESQFREMCKLPCRMLSFYDYEGVIQQERMQEMIDLLFGEKKQNVRMIQNTEKEMILLMPSEAEGDFEILRHCKEYFAAFGIKRVLICADDPVNSLKEIEDRWENLKKTRMWLQFYKKIGLHEPQTFGDRWKATEAELEVIYRKIRNELENGTLEQVSKQKEILRQCICRGMLPVEILKEKMINFLCHVCWKHMDDKQREQYKTSSIFSLNDAEDIETFWENSDRWLETIKLFLDEKKKQSRYSEAVEQVISYISEYYGCDISLNDLANHVHLNRSYLSTCFKKEVGENINTFLLNYRLECAKKLLISTNAKVQNICNEVGIPDSAYFSKQFKRYTGKRPSEWRKIHK